MAENRNMELNEEMMAEAAGGAYYPARFKVGDIVEAKIGSCYRRNRRKWSMVLFSSFLHGGRYTTVYGECALKSLKLIPYPFSKRSVTEAVNRNVEIYIRFYSE